MTNRYETDTNMSEPCLAFNYYQYILIYSIVIQTKCF